MKLLIILGILFTKFSMASCVVDVSELPNYLSNNSEIIKTIWRHGCEISDANPDFRIRINESCFLSDKPRTKFQHWAQENLIQREVMIYVINAHTNQPYKSIRRVSGLMKFANPRMNRRMIRSIDHLLDMAIEESSK